MPKYHVTLQSGRDFIMEHPYHKDDITTVHELAEFFSEEAAMMDDYLEDVELIDA